MENDKTEKLVAEITPFLKAKSSAELLQIWKENDHNVWTDEAFVAIRRILSERNVELPEQEPAKERKPEADLQGPELKKQLRLWSIGIILLGAVHFVPGIDLNRFLGVLLIACGVINWVVPMPGMFIIDGVLLWIVAIANILMGKGSAYTIIIVAQVLYGFLEVNKALYLSSTSQGWGSLFKLAGGEAPEEEAAPPAADVEKLIKKLGRNKEWVDWMARQSAAKELGELGAEAEEALPALKEALNDEKPEVREAAELAIQEIEEGLAAEGRADQGEQDSEEHQENQASS